jgi:hypothetical protein
VLYGARLTSVFKAATALAVAAQIRPADLKQIVAEANLASSEPNALAVVDAAREAHADTIRSLSAGFKAPFRRSAESMEHMTALLNLTAADMLDVPPAAQRETYVRLAVLWARLDKVVAQAQSQWHLIRAGG